MKVDTTRFGTLEIDESTLLTMPKGPYGFEGQTRFCLISHRPNAAFRWLQSTEDPELAFPVMDPSKFFSDYAFEISDADAEKLQLSRPEDALVIVVVTVPHNGKEVTANLAAPIVVNTASGIALQVVLENNRYAIRHKLVEQGNKKPRESRVGAA